MKNIMRIITSTRLLLLALLLASTTTAVAYVPLADTAKDIMKPLSHFTVAIFNICYILAIMLFFASITAYRNYRQNPSQTPLSRPIILLLLTITTALVPIIGKMSVSASYFQEYL